MQTDIHSNVIFSESIKNIKIGIYKRLVAHSSLDRMSLWVKIADNSLISLNMKKNYLLRLFTAKPYPNFVTIDEFLPDL